MVHHGRAEIFALPFYLLGAKLIRHERCPCSHRWRWAGGLIPGIGVGAAASEEHPFRDKNEARPSLACPRYLTADPGNLPKLGDLRSIRQSGRALEPGRLVGRWKDQAVCRDRPEHFQTN